LAPVSTGALFLSEEKSTQIRLDTALF
jgi:hypothetical protein